MGDKEVTSLPAMTTEEVFNQPVVIDNVTCPFLLHSFSALLTDYLPFVAQGTGILKAGFAGDQTPKCIFNT